MWSSPISIIIVIYAITVIEKKWHLVHQKNLKKYNYNSVFKQNYSLWIYCTILIAVGQQDSTTA